MNVFHLRISALFIVLLSGLFSSPNTAFAKSHATIFPVDLTCEYQRDPQVVDERFPRLSWINRAERETRGNRQTARQIQVATSRKLLCAGKPDLWDSQRVDGDVSTLVHYAGKPLKSGQTCWWRVRVWDENSAVSAWSEPANWCMGLLNPSDWQAQWIGVPWQEETPTDRSASETPPPAPLFRKTFLIDKPIREAKAFVTGLGYFELYLNGHKVGKDVLAPNQTDYGFRPDLDKKNIPLESLQKAYRVMYLGYDVTSLLIPGKNAVGGIVGNGFYNAVRHWVAGYGSPRFLMQLQIEYQDGSRENIITDDSWKVSKSAILHDMIYTGEHYDAQLEQPGWCEAFFDDSDWAQAIIRKSPGGRLVAQNGPPDRVMEQLKPVSIKLLENGNYRVDFGEEISGWLKINRVKGEAGRKIDIRYICESPVGDNSYTLKGSGEESYATRFTWYVFREVEISNWPGELTADQITAEAVYSNVTATSSFECSNSLFNTIHRIYKRSQTDNMHGSVPSDCPHRERSAYTGDGQACCSMVMHTFDAASFYNKWIADIGGSQNFRTGYVPNGAPWQPGCGGGPGWGAAMNIVPWEFYLHYDDVEIIQKYYASMKDQVRFMLSHTDDEGIMEMKDDCMWKTLGEWVPVSEYPPKAMVHTYFLYRCLSITAQAARVLDLQNEFDYYDGLAHRTNEAFQAKFWNEESQSYGTAGGNLFALKMGVPPERLNAVRKAIRKNIENNDYHLDTGIFGTQILFELLTDNGMHDLAYAIMNQHTAPSFGAWIEQGATTTWEQWDGGNSRNHPMFGSGLVWFYRKLAGVQIDPNHPGYRHFTVHPHPIDSLNYVRYSQQSIYGRVGASWTQDEHRFELTVDVPVSCTATIYVPLEKGEKITESGEILWQKHENISGNTLSKHCQLIDLTSGYAKIETDSGHYRFVVE